MRKDYNTTPRGKNVSSHDPRKKIIVELLKKESGGNRVTVVREVEPDVFVGCCLKSNGDMTHTELGFFKVQYKGE